MTRAAVEPIDPASDPAAYFDARAFRGGDGHEGNPWLGRLVDQVNRRFFAVVRGLLGHDTDETLAVQSEARDFMKAPTHAYPWSVDGARVLIRALGPGDGDRFARLLAVTERARDLFHAVGEACLTRAERARLEHGHVAGAAGSLIQTHEAWQVHHALHNDSRRAGVQMPLVGSFLLEQGPSAGRLRLWPSGWPAPRPLETMVGDLCLQRDCIEIAPGRMVYPITHGTDPGAGPEGSTRIVAILRFGIVPESTVQAAVASGRDLMDLYLCALTRQSSA